MILAVPFFGNDGRYRAMLDRWIEAHASSGCQLQFVVVSDYSEPLQNVPWLRVDTTPFAALVRDDNPMDRKGVIVLAALQVLGRCVVLDSDALIQKDPTRFLESLPDVAMGISPDVSGRKLKLPWSLEEFFEGCAGVMYFGSASRKDRVGLSLAYAQAFSNFADAHPDDYLLEQRAWSLACHRLGGFMLPKEMNWPPHHLGDNPNAYILHHHGPAKWAHNP